jgi:AraC-like DNA-binding protein
MFTVNADKTGRSAVAAPIVAPSDEELADIDDNANPILIKAKRISSNLCGRRHCHGVGQLIYPIEGRCRVRAGDHVWCASPQRAMWIPPGIAHSVHTIEETFVYNVYVCTEEIEGLPQQRETLSVSPLLHELISFAVALPRPSYSRPEHARLILAITDQIRTASSSATLGLPMSNDRRIKPILLGLLERPDDNRSLEAWANAVHSSPRTLARLFRQETGMTFRQWRQQLRAAEGMARLGAGESVLKVSLDLGYSSQSAFASMFRKAVGLRPSRCMRT